MGADENSDMLERVLIYMGDYVKDKTQLTEKRINGATLAEVLRQEFPGISFGQLGFKNLAGLIDEAEKRGYLVRHRDVKHLEVSCSSETPAQESSTAKSSHTHINPDIWKAFAVAGRQEPNFFDKNTRRVVVGTGTSGQGHDLVPILPVPADTQKDWMKEFAKEQGIELDQILEALESPQWWVEFLSVIRREFPDKDLLWRSYRAKRLVDHICKWASQNNIPKNLLSPGQSSAQNEHNGMGEDGLREAIVSTISELPLSELERLSIPLYYIIRHFVPRR